MENVASIGKQHRWFRYSDIILFRTVASLKAEAQKTYVGYIWWFFEPLINTVVFYLIFSMIMHRDKDLLVRIMVGTVTWQWLQTTVIISSQSVIQKAFLLQNVYLPKYIFPSVSVLSNTFKFLFLFTALIIILAFVNHGPNPAYFSLIVILPLQFLLVGSVSVLSACLMPYFPDGEIVLDAFLRAMMLLSGVFFTPSNLASDASSLLINLFYLNPMANLIIAYRSVLLQGQMPSWSGLTYVAAFDLVLLAITVWVFKRVDRQLVKVIAQS